MIYSRPISALIIFFVCSFFSFIIRLPIYCIYLNAGLNPYMSFIFTLLATWPVLAYFTGIFIQIYSKYILKQDIKLNYTLSSLDQYITGNRASYLILLNMFMTMLDLNIFSAFYNKWLDVELDYKWAFSILKDQILEYINLVLLFITNTFILIY